MSIEILPVDKKVDPGTDFYSHINNSWQKEAHIPDYLAKFGISEEIEECIDKKLQTIVDAAKPKSSIGILTESFLSLKSKKNGLHTLKNILDSYKCIRDINDVGRVLGECSLYNIDCIFSIYTMEHENDNHKNRIVLDNGSIGLPDISYYKGTAPGKTTTLNAYKKLLTTVGNLLEINIDLTKIVHIEETLALIADKYEFDKNETVSIRMLKIKYKYIPWDSFWNTLGVKGNLPIIVVSKRWMRSMNRLCKNMTIEDWKVLFTGSIVIQMLSLLPHPFDDLFFEFYGKRLQDQKEKMAQKKFALKLTESYLSDELSREYIKMEFSLKKKHEVEEFVKSLVVAAKERMEDTVWLEKKTRARAIKKLEALKLGIAYPDKWQTIDLPKLNSENIIENILSISKCFTMDDLSREGLRSKKMSEWDDAVFAVNAYYYGGENGLIIPAGIISWPFFKERDAPIGWNHGALGAVIGHEITHAFDTNGKNYDEYGNLEPWWSVADNRAYGKKTKALLELFNNTKYLDHKVNGFRTLSENISDIGGMGIALHALGKLIGSDRRKQSTVLAQPPEYSKFRAQSALVPHSGRKEALQNFFTAYAMCWRSKIRLTNAYKALLTDRHAPPMLRVNLVVNNFDEWYEAFDIGPDDKLYRDPKDRIRIF